MARRRTDPVATAVDVVDAVVDVAAVAATVMAVFSREMPAATAMMAPNSPVPAKHPPKNASSTRR